MIKKGNSHIYKSRLGRHLIYIREKSPRLTQEYVAHHTGICSRTLCSVEYSYSASCEQFLITFWYYDSIGRVTPAERRLFFYLFDHLRW